MNHQVNHYQIGESAERPWGNWHVIACGANFVVKQILVKPRQKLSLQRHRFRSEHWILVSGSAEIIINDIVSELRMDHCAFIAAGQTHRLSNNSAHDLVLIEIQQGEQLDENDIERLDDVYGRV